MQRWADPRVLGAWGGRSGTVSMESLSGRKHRACQLSLDVCLHPSSCPALLHSTLFSCPSSSFTGRQAIEPLVTSLFSKGESVTCCGNWGFGMLLSLSLDLCKCAGFNIPMSPPLSELFQITPLAGVQATLLAGVQDTLQLVHKQLDDTSHKGLQPL